MSESGPPSPISGAGSSGTPAKASARAWIARLYPPLVIAIGSLARLLAARGSFLMPDESWHMRIATAGDLASVYRESLQSAHPPLFMFALHFWSEIARTQWQLRWLAVAFGAASLVAAWHWTRLLLGQAGSFVALALFSLLPSLVLLSAELRAYSLLLLLLAAGLACLERAFARESLAWLLASAAFAGLALLTHYAALWVILATGAYAAARILSRRPCRRFVGVWLLTQAGLCSLCLGLYVSHISKLRGGELEADAQGRWLKESYFGSGVENPFRFAARQTFSVFTYIFSTPVAAALALALFVFALAWTVRRRQPVALLLALPFLFQLAAGLLGLFPYGGTRHSIDLALVVCAAVGLALARVTRESLWIGVVLALVLAPAALAAGW